MPASFRQTVVGLDHDVHAGDHAVQAAFGGEVVDRGADLGAHPCGCRTSGSMMCAMRAPAPRTTISGRPSCSGVAGVVDARRPAETVVGRCDESGSHLGSFARSAPAVAPSRGRTARRTAGAIDGGFALRREGAADELLITCKMLTGRNRRQGRSVREQHVAGMGAMAPPGGARPRAGTRGQSGKRCFLTPSFSSLRFR